MVSGLSSPEPLPELGKNSPSNSPSVDLIWLLIARRQQKLDALAQSLHRQYGVAVRSVAVDLSQPNFMDTIEAATDDIEIGLLVNNAGLYKIGEFLDQSLDYQLKILDVNTRAPLILSYHFGQEMRHRGQGGIILVSSTVGGTGAPMNANYAATKSYDLILGEGLHHEIKQHGVDVQILMPGGTRTEGSTDMMKHAPTYMQMMLMDTAPVVKQSLTLLGRKTAVIPGLMNQSMVFMVARLMPRKLAVNMWGMMMKGMLPKSTRQQSSKPHAS